MRTIWIDSIGYMVSGTRRGLFRSRSISYIISGIFWWRL